MRSRLVILVGIFTLVGSLVGCASRTRVDLGVMQVAGQVQAYDSWQPLSFELSLDKISATGGYTGFMIESNFGECEESVGIFHSTGTTDKVFSDVSGLDNN